VRTDWPEPSLDVNFMKAEIVADPFPHYERIRSVGRCVRNGLAGVWMVTGYDDAVDIFRDVGRFSSRILADDTFGPWYSGASTMLGSDPPEHTRLRSALRQPFTVRSLGRWEPLVRRTVADLLREALGDPAHGEPIDFLEGVAFPLPALVTARLLGVPEVDAPRVVAWTHEMVVGSVASTFAEAEPDAAEVYRRAVEAGFELADYVRDRLLRGPGPADDADGILSRLLAAERAGVLTRPEVTATCVLLLLAGTETTAKLIANAVVLLAEHPDQRERLLAEPSLITSAVEEVLRFSGPAQFDPRLVTEDVSLGGVRLAAGDRVWVLTAAAGRDAAHFPIPSRFDIRRTPNAHLGFGHGLHLCLGAPLARMEAVAAVQALLHLMPHYTIAELDYGRAFFVRGPTRLRLDVGVT
jgi:cytochrome P450